MVKPTAPAANTSDEARATDLMEDRGAVLVVVPAWPFVGRRVVLSDAKGMVGQTHSSSSSSSSSRVGMVSVSVSLDPSLRLSLLEDGGRSYLGGKKTCKKNGFVCSCAVSSRVIHAAKGERICMDRSKVS
eukprot:scaffold14698_cov196-Amphora_coffeaeformis.AAC.1